VIDRVDGRVIIVTAADQRFWRSLYQFLRSAERQGLFDRYRVIAYDLGLSPDTRASLQRRFGLCEFRRFDFSAHPPHVAMARGTYAWKPVIVSDLAEEFGGAFILWFDSATILKSDLAEVLADIRRRGVHVLKGFDLLLESCNPLTLQALDAPLDYMYRRTRPAGYVGLDTSQNNARKLVRLWREHALIESHIAPTGPVEPWPRNRWHRYDQSLLTILLNRMADAGEVDLTDDEMDMSSPHPVKWMTTRNKVWPFMPRWTDPLLNACWSVGKAVDIGYRRVARVYTTRLRGLHRMPGEHFTVFLRRAGEARAVAVPAPATSYYADPMLWRQDGRLWLFVEELQYGCSRGRLCALPLDDDLRARGPVPLLQGYLHVSYPFLTRIGDALCLLPETSSDRGVDLYVCERFPDRWRLRRRILQNVDAADSTLLHYAGLWWLFTFVRADPGKENRFLAIYFTDDPLGGEWRAHPLNTERRYAEHRFNSLRSAGPFIVEDGRLFRPVQINPDYYGQSLGLMQVDCLTPLEFFESRFGGKHWATDPKLADAHHVSRAGDVLAFDRRDRVGLVDRLRRALRQARNRG
jgi:hypothetical protein